MSRTPTTPFIPPLLSPHPSPSAQPSPVIPGYTPAYPPSNYPVYPHSPHANQSPFIPPSPSGIGNNLPPSNSRQSNNGGISADYTGYPQGAPFTPPMASPAHMQTPYVPAPGPLPGWPTSAPANFHNFAPPAAAPWPGAAAPYPSPYGASPYALPNIRMPPPGNFTPYTPYTPQLPPQGWGPPPQPYGYAPPQPPPMNPIYGWGPQQPPMGPSMGPPMGPPMGPTYGHPAPEPPAQVYDRMDPFTLGLHYGPVLDPFLIKVVKAQVRLNPLISPLPDDGPDGPHLKWDMLFPPSTVRRSDKAAESWMDGRDDPATFPRLSSLRIVSTQIPWMIEVKAKHKDHGVTCGEVIDTIGSGLDKLSYKQDFDNLSERDQVELTQAYKHNRSPKPGVPGGTLGRGMKRLDFLRMFTTFAGIEVDDRTVRRLCGSELPCVFVLRCRERYMSPKDVQEQEMRMRNAAAGGNSSKTSQTTTTTTTTSTSRSTSRGPPTRSRANSNARITVQPPSTTSRDSDDGDVDR